MRAVISRRTARLALAAGAFCSAGSWAVAAPAQEPCGVVETRELRGSEPTTFLTRIADVDALLVRMGEARAAGRSAEVSALAVDARRALQKLADMAPTTPSPQPPNAVFRPDCHARILYRRGQVEALLGDYVAAYATFKRAQSARTPGDRGPLWQDDRAASAEAARRLMPEVKVVITGSDEEGATAYLGASESPFRDGPVEPGKTTIEIRGRGFRPHQETRKLEVHGEPWEIRWDSRGSELLAPVPASLKGTDAGKKAEEGAASFEAGLAITKGDPAAPFPAEWEAAYRRFAEAAKLAPDEPAIVYGRGRLALATKRFAAARADLDLVIKSESQGKLEPWVIARAKRLAGRIEGEQMARVKLAIRLESPPAGADGPALTLKGMALTRLSWGSANGPLFVAVGAEKDAPRKVRDGDRLLIEPGEREIEVTSKGYVPWRKRVTWGVGDGTYDVDLKLVPPLDRTPRHWGLGLTLGGAAAAIAGGVMLPFGVSDIAASNHIAANETEQDALDRLAERGTLLSVGGGIAAGLGLVSAGVGLYLWRPWASDEPQGERIGLHVGPGGLRVEGAF